MSNVTNGGLGAVRPERSFPADFFHLHSPPLNFDDPDDDYEGSAAQAAKRVLRARKQAKEAPDKALQYMTEIEAIMSAPQPTSAPSRQALTHIIAEGAHIASQDPAEIAARMFDGMVRDAALAEEYRRIAEQTRAGDHHSVIGYFLDKGLCLEQARLNARRELRMRARPQVRELVRRLKGSEELMGRAERAAMRLVEARESLRMEAEEPSYADRVVNGPQYTPEYLQHKTRLVFAPADQRQGFQVSDGLECDAEEQIDEEFVYSFDRGKQSTKQNRRRKQTEDGGDRSLTGYKALARKRPFNPYEDDPELVLEQLLWKGTSWAIAAGWSHDDKAIDDVAAEFAYYVQARLCAPGRRKNKETGEMEPAVLLEPSWAWLRGKWRAFIAEYRATEGLCKAYAPIDDLLVADDDAGATEKEAVLPSDDPFEDSVRVEVAKDRYEAYRASLPSRQQSHLDEMYAAVVHDDGFDPANRSALANAMDCPRTTLNSRVAKITAEFRERGAKDAMRLEDRAGSLIATWVDEHVYEDGMEVPSC